MNALGSTAFAPGLTPMSLYQASLLVLDEHPEESEELGDFAVDFATILNLPSFTGWVRGEANDGR